MNMILFQYFVLTAICAESCHILYDIIIYLICSSIDMLLYYDININMFEYIYMCVSYAALSSISIWFDNCDCKNDIVCI